MPRHPLVTVFPACDIIPEAVARLNDKGRAVVHQGRGATVALAMLDLAARLENLAAEIRAAAES